MKTFLLFLGIGRTVVAEWQLLFSVVSAEKWQQLQSTTTYLVSVAMHMLRKIISHVIHSRYDSFILLFLSIIDIVNRVANFQTLVWDLRLFVILQTFLLLFCTCLKPRLFCTFHHKTTSKHPRIKEFWLYFAKISVTPDKNEKSAPTQLALPPDFF